LQTGALAELPGRGFLFLQFANPFGVSNPKRVVSPEDQKTLSLSSTGRTASSERIIENLSGFQNLTDLIHHF
jgi:hypothetical protein